MSENKEIKKILISFSKDSDFVRKKIDELSEKSGLSKSRIYEECLMFGFVCMYDNDDIERYKQKMGERYCILNRNIIDNIDKVLTTLKPES